MDNVIQITRADNQVIMVAYTGEVAYTLCNIQSGFTGLVDVSIAIAAGDYAQITPIYNGKGAPTVMNFIITIPAGAYNLVAIGIEWGGGLEFAATFNGAPIPFKPNGVGGSIYFNETPLPFTVNPL